MAHTRVRVTAFYGKYKMSSESDERGAKFRDEGDIKRITDEISENLRKRHGQDVELKISTWEVL